MSVTLNRNIKPELNAKVTNPNPSLGTVRHQDHGRHQHLEPVPYDTEDDTTEDTTLDPNDDGGEPDAEEVEDSSK